MTSKANSKKEIVNRTVRMRGFTLVELIVAMGIFVSVTTIAVGALFSAQSMNLRLEQTQVILDEVHLATEVMVRDIRYGKIFNCGSSVPESVAPQTRQSCAYPNGRSALIFRPATILSNSTDQSRDRVAYFVSNGILYKREYPYGGSVSTSQLTSSSVNVDALTFFVTGAMSKSDNEFNQPLITIILSGVTVPQKRNLQPVYFSVQTAASSREIDN